MSKIGIIVNRNAKKVRTGVISAERFREIGADLADLRETATFEELDGALRDFRDGGYPYIGIAGGDGTIHHVLTRMIRAYESRDLPAVLLLKGGTMDNVARSVGLKGQGTDILKRLMISLRHGRVPETRMRDTINIDDRFGSIFGIGFIINFMHEAYGGKEKGAKQNIIALSKAIRHGIKEPRVGSLYEGIQAEVTVNGRQLAFTNITAILAATIEGFGLGFYPLKKATRYRDTYHALISGLNGRQIISRIIHLRQGWEIRHPLVCDEIVRDMTIRSESPFTYTMDGDFYESDGCIRVSTGPGIRYVFV